MQTNVDTLICQMKMMLAEEGITVTQCMTPERVTLAEKRLGFQLPPLLKRMYTEVGNGLFGVFPLDRDSYYLADDFGLVDSYVEMRSISQEEVTEAFNEDWDDDDEKPSLWPEKLVMFYDWGDGMYSCIDCNDPDYQVLRSDSNMSHSQYAVESTSLEQWFHYLLDGNLFFDWDEAEKKSFA